MGKILEAFLSDQLCVDEMAVKRKPEHQRLCERSSMLQEKLAEKLNGEEKEILAELVDTLFQEGSFDAQRKFERGYRLGVLLTSEIYAERDIFFYEEENR